jgi:putative transposase
VTTSVRREVVELFKSRGHSERHACELAGLGRSSCRYRVLLRREGQVVNRKRVYRLYKAAGLAVRRRTRRKLRVSRPSPSVALLRPNERWSMDFVHDYLSDGRRLRTFHVVDAFTQECLAIEVDLSLPAARVVRVLDTLVWRHGLPESLRIDNGPEFISTTLDRWAIQHGVRLDFIQPGKPTQNARVESFNGHFRDECLAQAPWPTLDRARVEAELWRVDYNCVRPHSSLRYETPKAFADRVRCQAPPSAGAAAASVAGADEAHGQSTTCQLVETRMGAAPLQRREVEEIR